MSNTPLRAPLRATGKFIDWFCIGYFGIAFLTLIYLWVEVPVFSEFCTNIIGFGFNLMFVVIGALIWPGTLLSLACMGW